MTGTYPVNQFLYDKGAHRLTEQDHESDPCQDKQPRAALLDHDKKCDYNYGKYPLLGIRKIGEKPVKKGIGAPDIQQTHEEVIECCYPVQIISPNDLKSRWYKICSG